MQLHDLLPSCLLKAAESLLLCSGLLPLAWVLAPLLAGETSAYSLSHFHMDHTVWYSLALCLPILMVGLMTPTFHRLWP